MQYRNILHIDDDEDDREIFLTALRSVTNEINYIGIDSASSALQQLIHQTVRPDIIFLDLNMPEMNGQQFLLELCRNPGLKQIPVIVLSTSAHKPTIHLMKEIGAHDFITKPNSFDEFGRKLLSILS